MAENVSTLPSVASHTLPPESVPHRPVSNESKLGEGSATDSMTGAIQPPSTSSAVPASAAGGPADNPTSTSADSEPKSQPHDSQPSEPPADTTQDKETAAADESSVAVLEGTDPIEPEANGTPASSKKTPRRQKSTASPYQRGGHKLNKKKSKIMVTHLDAKPGEYYFARLKSYSPWPSIICDEQMLPQSLLSTRPVTTKQIDGTYRELYDDGGKRAHERTFPIMFLHTNEFAWIPNTDLTPLRPEDVKDFPEKSKSKALIQAYHVAAEQHDLQYFKTVLADHMLAMQEDQAAREAKAAEKIAKAERAAKRGKRKSVEVAEDDEDEDVAMDDAGDDVEVKPKGSKKRKKDIDSDGETEKPAKTPKTTTKLKLSTPKTPATTEGKKGRVPKEPKAKASAKKAEKAAAAKASSDDDGEPDTPMEPEKPLSPQELKLKKEKEVLYLRHKLQKGLLTRDQIPKEEEMASMSDFIQKLERYPDLEASTIRTTKIYKVLKLIIRLSTIPKDEEYDIRARSIELLGKWNKLLGATEAGPSGDAAASEATGEVAGEKDEPSTNGVHKDEGDGSETAGVPEQADTETNEKNAGDHDLTSTEKTEKAEEADSDIPMKDGGVEPSKETAPATETEKPIDTKQDESVAEEANDETVKAAEPQAEVEASA